MRLNRLKSLSRLLWRLTTSPWVSIPLGLGAASLGLGFALEDTFLRLLGRTGVFIGFGGAVTKWVLLGRELVLATHEDTNPLVRREHEQVLDDLARRLELDHDRRTYQFLEQLRRLYERMHLSGIFDALLPEPLLPDIQQNLERLYRSCLSTLERMLVLWKAAQGMQTVDALLLNLVLPRGLQPAFVLVRLLVAA